MRDRQHLRLSADADTAENVGSHQGKPVVLVVRADAMATAGHACHPSENGARPTDAVPVDLIDFGTA